MRSSTRPQCKSHYLPFGKYEKHDDSLNPNLQKKCSRINNFFGTTELLPLKWNKEHHRSSHRNYNNNSNTAQLFWGSRGQRWHSADSITLQTFRCVNIFSLFWLSTKCKINYNLQKIFLLWNALLKENIWKIKQTRPSVNYAKDWLDHSFLFPGLVWIGFYFGCDH